MLKRVCALVAVLVVTGWGVRAAEPVSPVCAAVAAKREVNRELAAYFAKEIAEGEEDARRRFCGDAGNVYSRYVDCGPRPDYVVSRPSTANCIWSGERVWRVADGGLLVPLDRLPAAAPRFMVHKFENRGASVEFDSESAFNGEFRIEHSGAAHLDWADGGVQLRITDDTFY